MFRPVSIDWQVIRLGIFPLLFVLGSLANVWADAPAAESAAAFRWDPPVVKAGGFSRELGMLDPERDEYATHLAHLVAQRVAAAKASPASLAEARRMLGLALHLSPRNRRAVVVHFQLTRGILPEPQPAALSAQGLARLLLARGQLLRKMDGPEDQAVARWFIQLAAECDPKNEDAIYASEVLRLDEGEPDWKPVTDGQAASRSPAPEGEGTEEGE